MPIAIVEYLNSICQTILQKKEWYLCSEKLVKYFKSLYNININWLVHQLIIITILALSCRISTILSWFCQFEQYYFKSQNGMYIDKEISWFIYYGICCCSFRPKHFRFPYVKFVAFQTNCLWFYLFWRPDHMALSTHRIL